MKWIFILSIVGSCAFAESETKTFEAKTIRTVDIENSSGLTKIVGTDADKASVIVEKLRFTDQCEMKIVQSGSTLSVEVERQKLALGVDCKANITLNIPKDSSVDVKSGSGNIEISGISRDIEFKVGSGDVKIDGQIEKLDGKSGSGYFSLTGSVVDAEIKSGTGEINFNFTSLPKPGEIDIKTGSGNAAFTLPSAADVAVSMLSASGSTQNEFAINKKAKFKISFKSGSGNLVVKKSVASSTN